jgi:CRISPR-associated protein Csx17
MTAGIRMHSHTLSGCHPTPLGGYLKAVGILRVVAEQVDPNVRGFWTAEGFVLLTRMSRDELLRFFLYSWQPTPWVSPWNKGSGLLAPDPKGVRPIEESVAKRFEPLREGIASAKKLTRRMEAAVAAEKTVKNEKKSLTPPEKEALANDPEYKRRLAAADKTCKRLKDQLQPDCQKSFRGGAARWFRAAIVLTADGRAVFPGLLGTGGNDGKLDFTNNALQRLADLFSLDSDDGGPKPSAHEQLLAALFGEAAPVLVRGGIGQYAPGRAGGPNATSGALGDSFLNPWDLPLLLEGALLFAAGTSRRLGAAGSERTVAPFSARTVSAGYGSAAVADESARGEQWLPLWERPWKASELAAVLREGRCQIGARPTDTGLEVARAVSALGVARGIVAFERYGFFERNGKSNFAVPLGRFKVRASSQARLLEDLDRGSWWERLRRAARDERAPNRLAHLDRRLNNAVMAALAHGDEPARWQAVLVSLAEIEAQFVLSDSFAAAKSLGPLPPLSPDWIRAVDDGDPR